MTVSKFRDYLKQNNELDNLNENNNQDHLSLQEIIEARKKLLGDLKKLQPFIHKDSQKNFKKALTFIKPDLLEKINPINEEYLTEKLSNKKGKTDKKTRYLINKTNSLIKITDSVLFLPYYGKENEKYIKTDYYNLCSAISIILFSKLDDKVTLANMKAAGIKLNESEEKELKEGEWGQFAGGLTGSYVGSMFGPAGALVGLIIGIVYGNEAGDKLAQKYEELKDKFRTDIDWHEVVVNIGIYFGSIAGLLTFGGVGGLVITGVVGGTVAFYLYEFVNEDEDIKYDSQNNKIIYEGKISDFFKNITSKVKKYAKSIINVLTKKQRKLEKKLQEQYKIRLSRIN